jgi:DNA-binding MarR family transcriptional regulator
MVESGWIVKRTTDEDRRVVNLYLTARAKEVKAPMLKEVAAVNSKVLSSFKAEERLLLERMLKDLWK